MSRLQSEWQRLYLPAQPGQIRAMAMALAGPGAWDALSKAWRGVQEDLQLPAPGIAVAGEAGHQLWFSLAEPVPLAQAHAFLEALRVRYLPEVARERVRFVPNAAAEPLALPPRELEDARWAAFVAPDLAALFSEEPFLDIPPGEDAQADLLSRLQAMKPAEFARATTPRQAPAPAPAAAQDDPRRFLLSVMNDPAVPLPLRIEAAKALLHS